MLKETIRDIRHEFVEMITHTFDANVGGVVDSWIDRRLKKLVNAALDEAAQLAEDIDSGKYTSMKTAAEAIREMKVK